MRTKNNKQLHTALALIGALCLVSMMTACGKDDEEKAKPSESPSQHDKKVKKKKKAKTATKDKARDDKAPAPEAKPKTAKPKTAKREAMEPTKKGAVAVDKGAVAIDKGAVAVNKGLVAPTNGAAATTGNRAALADKESARAEPKAAVLPPNPTPAPGLDKPRAEPLPEPPLDISGYLSIADLERVLDKKHKFRRTTLPGLKASPTYNSVYYADRRGKEFGISVQVWRDRNLIDSRTRFNTLRNTYTDVVKTDRITNQGFRAYYGGVVTLVFADPRRPLVAAVSCSIKICSANAAIELSRRVAERIR